MTKKTEDSITCQVCGKVLTREQAQENEMGAYCEHLLEEGWDARTLAEHRLSMSAGDVPTTEDGQPYIKVAALHKLLVKKGIPVSRMVRAFGGDRALDPPLHPKFRVVYVGNARWLDPWCATEAGLNFLRGMTGRASNGRKTDKATKEIEAALS